MPPVALRRAVGSPPYTTMRRQLHVLSEIGVIEHKPPGLPRSLDYSLTPTGHDLLAVARVLQAWLAVAPQGEIALGSIAAQSATKALVGGWSSAIVRALAARPLSLTELARLISNFSYPSLERRLGALRLTGQIEARPSRTRHTPYEVSEWLRRAVAPILAGVRWERRHLPADTVPVGRIDAEAALLLSMPLLKLPSNVAGTCRLAVEFRNGAGEPQPAGAVVEVRDGAVCSCVSRLDGHADAWVSGSPSSWITALTDRQVDVFEVGGDCDLAIALLGELHGVLSEVGGTVASQPREGEAE